MKIAVSYHCSAVYYKMGVCYTNNAADTVISGLQCAGAFSLSVYGQAGVILSKINPIR